MGKKQEWLERILSEQASTEAAIRSGVSAPSPEWNKKVVRKRPKSRKILAQIPSKPLIETRPWFTKRIYIRESVDLTPLCLAIIAPDAVHASIVEGVLEELKLCRKYRQKMREKHAQLLRDWIKEFKAINWERYRIRSVRPGEQFPVSDQRFVEQMFRSLSHQFSLDGRRIGNAECDGLTIQSLTRISGPSPFSRAWANARAADRRRIQRITHILNEEGELNLNERTI